MFDAVKTPDPAILQDGENPDLGVMLKTLENRPAAAQKRPEDQGLNGWGSATGSGSVAGVQPPQQLETSCLRKPPHVTFLLPGAALNAARRNLPLRPVLQMLV